MQNLNIALVQSELHWEDKQANLQAFEKTLEHIARPVDLIVLPEMFTTGFTMNAAALAETMQGTTVKWLMRMAASQKTDILGSAIISENGRYWNRLLWARPDGTCLHYDKRHLFRMAAEQEIYAAGAEKLVVELKGWKICPFVCYDLRFPVWMRNLGNHYDVAVVIANWPQQRAEHWRKLLQARAIENLAYVVGVNRVGKDGKNLEYSGDSCVVDPRGEVLYSARHIECVQVVSLSHARLQRYRQSFPAWQDADDFEIKLP